MNRDQFRGLTALITGGTGGIGAAVAKRFASGGASVMINGFGEAAAISALLEELRSLSGAGALHDAADLGKADDVARMVQRCAVELGGPDIVVNNAGVQYVAPTEDFPLEQWDKLIAVNLTAPFLVIKAALPGMKQRGFGRVINIASAHGLVASAGKSAYVAAKHGLIGLTKAVALETAELDVTVNALCPGWVDTPLVRTQIAKRAQASGRTEAEEADLLVSEKHPNRKFCPPETIADAAAFLADRSNRYCTGSSLVVDGGWTAQ